MRNRRKEISSYPRRSGADSGASEHLVRAQDDLRQVEQHAGDTLVRTEQPCQQRAFPTPISTTVEWPLKLYAVAIASDSSPYVVASSVMFPPFAARTRSTRVLSSSGPLVRRGAVRVGQREQES